jgi:hypothetical protein
MKLIREILESLGVLEQIDIPTEDFIKLLSIHNVVNGAFTLALPNFTHS